MIPPDARPPEPDYNPLTQQFLEALQKNPELLDILSKRADAWSKAKIWLENNKEKPS